MPLADSNISNSKAPAVEDSDHIGSGASTPPGGAHTPRPDLVDKRMPQIQNYFAQVRDSLDSSITSLLRPAPSGPPSSSPCADMDAESQADQHSAKNLSAQHGLLTAPTSPSSLTSSFDAHEPPMLPHERPNALRTSVHTRPHNYNPSPTPPLSTSSSMLGLDGARSRKKSYPVSPPLRMRSNTLTSNTITNVISAPPVTAVISNPASSSASPYAPSSPAVASRRSSGSASPSKRKRSLTGGSPLQNTPPQTPRALSQESKHDDVSSSLSQVTMAEKQSRSSSNNSNSVPSNHIKGQMAVSIIEGRGLRPSTAPYVVCIFQLNEDISEGAEADAMDTRQDGASEKEEDLVKGAAMRRMGSDSGRPLSIPGLRSRQTSQTNIAKLKDSAPDNQVTAPVWKHDTVL